jgi:hypothetical protein
MYRWPNLDLRTTVRDGVFLIGSREREIAAMELSAGICMPHPGYQIFKVMLALPAVHP